MNNFYLITLKDLKSTLHNCSAVEDAVLHASRGHLSTFIVTVLELISTGITLFTILNYLV